MRPGFLALNQVAWPRPTACAIVPDSWGLRSVSAPGYMQFKVIEK
jgi:hypothetical protein